MRKWTAQELAIIQEEVIKSPNNLRHAFENASRRLSNRKVHSISAKWYLVRDKCKALVVTASPTSPILKNIKNTPRTPIRNPQGDVVDFKSVMRDIIKLPAKELSVLRQYIDCIS